jgi:hypothetical protein
MQCVTYVISWFIKQLLVPSLHIHLIKYWPEEFFFFENLIFCKNVDGIKFLTFQIVLFV